MKKVLISGYYGFGNIGDEAILASTVSAIRAKDPSIRITVLSKSPRETARTYGICAVPRMSFAQVVGALRGSDLVIFGGGSLLQDSTSFRSLVYYLSILFLSHLLNKPVVVYANGIGPLTSKTGRNLTRIALSRVKQITVRDFESRDLLRDIGVNRHIRVTADPAFLLEPAPPARVDEILEAQKVGHVSVWLALRPGKAPGTFYRSLANSAARFRTLGLEPCLLIMQERDLGLVESFNRYLGEKGERPVPFLSGLTPAEALGVLQKGEFCVGMRLHTLILSARAGVPYLGVEIDPKIGAFCRMTGCPVLPNPTLSCSDPEAAVMALAGEREALSRDLGNLLPNLISLARENLDIVLSTLRVCP